MSLSPFPLPKPLLLSLQLKRPSLPLPQALSPPSCPPYFFHYFPLYSAPLLLLASLYPPIYFPLIFSASLHPLTLSIPRSKWLCFPSCVLRPHSFAHTHMHAGTHTNDHIRQMTLITVCLECKNTEKRRPKHLLYIPSAFRDYHLLCTLLSSKKLQANTNSLHAIHLVTWMINEF